jgi:tetratricopeptide (TPR) repeat protein
VVHGRFELTRPLPSRGLCSCWAARDLESGEGVLLRVYETEVLRTRGLLDEVERSVADACALEHPAVAPVLTMRDADGVLAIAIATGDAGPLAEWVRKDRPSPHERVFASVRGPIEALARMRSGGAAHAHLDGLHVIVDRDGAWRVLPPEVTAPGCDDLAGLGEVIASALTGGDPPAAARSLNDYPDRLHDGRTMPALLDQLVTDLRSPEIGRRPAGMAEVLRRLDQHEAARPASVVTIDAAAERPPVAAPVKRRLPTAIIGLVGAGLIVGGVAVGALLFGGAAAPSDPATPVAEQQDPLPAEPAPEIDPGGDESEDADRRRAEASAALDRYVAVRAEADVIGASTWGGGQYDSAAATAAEADRHFLAQEYVPAREAYTTAAEEFASLVASSEEALARLLREGRAALEAPDADAAGERFAAALLIEPGNDEALAGMRRASTLNEFNRLMASGRAHERAGRHAFAHTDYAAAAALDPLAPEAEAAAARALGAEVESQFRESMGRGLEAFHRGEYDAARQELLGALSRRPGEPEAERVLAMIEEARSREMIERLLDRARGLESGESWQEAWNVYRRVLAIDPEVKAALDGKMNAERMIDLMRRARRFLDDPSLLMVDGEREAAARLLVELGDLPAPGPRTARAMADLADRVRQATTPTMVTLRSDGLTSVVVFRVGRYGTFEERRVEVLPGEYTVVGRRRGYKDVRLTLRVPLGGEPVTLEVICTEVI